MYSLRLVLSAFVALLFLAKVEGYGGGAPEKACVTMTPGHPELPQEVDSPYQLVVNAAMVGRGQKVNGK